MSNINNISLSWYTDGVRIFKSSNYSIWPFVFTIDELPPEERFKIENMLIAAIHVGNEKPIPNLFLQPVKKELRQLYKGVKFTTPNGERNVRVVTIAGTCDLPAKALFLNMVPYNGKLYYIIKINLSH